VDEPEVPPTTGTFLHGSSVSVDVARQDDLVERAIHRYDAALRGFLRWKMGVDEDEVQDALQETYENLLRYRQSEWEDLPRALVMRIAANVVIDRARHRASRHSRQHISVDDFDLESSEATPERRVLAQEDIALVRSAIVDMPERCQEVFILSRIKGMNYQQIADHLSISVKAVEKHISRALTLCRQRVGESRR
jgi:RNA polymerase sigma-70 factor (ECF subfamily)